MPLLSTLASASARGYGFNLSVSNSEDENATGVSATGGVGSITATTTNFISTTGVSATASAGAATVQITDSSVTVNLTGVSATASSGSASAIVPPSAQYFVGYYKYLSSGSTDFGVNAVCYKWDGANVTLVGGSTGTGFVTRGSSSLVSSTEPPLAATNVADAYGNYSVYFLNHGYNSSTGAMSLMGVQFAASNGSVVAGPTTYATVSISGTNVTGRAISVGYNNTRAGLVVSHTATSGAKIRLYTIDPANNGALTALNFVTSPPVSGVFYTAIAMHPTDDLVTFGTDVTGDAVYAYKNIGRSSSPVEENTSYTYTQLGLGTSVIRQMKWSYSGDYLAIGADEKVVIVPYNSSTKELSVGSAVAISLSTDFDNPKLEWGPGDAYLLVSGDLSTSNALATIQQSGGSWSLNAYQYPNSYANAMTALNYDGSYLFNLVYNAPSDLNIRVLSMESGNTGIPTSTVWTSNSLGTTTTRDFFAAVALPPVQT